MAKAPRVAFIASGNSTFASVPFKFVGQVVELPGHVPEIIGDAFVGLTLG